MKSVTIFLTFLVLLISCNNEKPKEQSIDRLVSRINGDPDRINPLLNPSSKAREVYQYIMLQLAEQNPITLEYDPLLITKIPEAEKITEGNNAGNYSYSFEILKDAKWSDGSMITAEDYVFTIKLLYHKGMNLAGYKTVYGGFIEDIVIDPNDNQNFTVITNQADETVITFLCGIEVYPRKFYDPNSVLEKYSLNDLFDESNYEAQIEEDPSLAEFAVQFQDVKYSRDVVEGAGPYELTSWENDQFIRLKRKENYWGDAYPDRYPLQAYPNEIIFQIIADDVTVINQLGSGDLDLVTLASTTGEKFQDLKQDKIISDQYNFYTPRLMRYLNIQLNNESPYLEDKRVRQALAHLIDVDRLIEVVEGGIGSRVTSIFSDLRTYYNPNLEPLKLDIEKAKTLLNEAGWTDTNGDGTVDKIINGEKTEMKIRLHTSSSALGQRVALTMKEGAAKAGIDISLITQSFRVTRPQNLMTGDFEMVPMMFTLSPIDVPFNRWHSSQIGGQGQNFTRFSNSEVDEIIEELASTENEKRRDELFFNLQQVIYDEHPMIMLYAPVEKIVVKKEYDPLITSRKPGYLLNSFKKI